MAARFADGRWLLPTHEPATNLPTPGPSQEGNNPRCAAPLLGGAGGGFMGTNNELSFEESLPGEQEGRGEGERSIQSPAFVYNNEQ